MYPVIEYPICNPTDTAANNSGEGIAEHPVDNQDQPMDFDAINEQDLPSVIEMEVTTNSQELCEGETGANRKKVSANEDMMIDEVQIFKP